MRSIDSAFRKLKDLQNKRTPIAGLLIGDIVSHCSTIDNGGNTIFVNFDCGFSGFTIHFEQDEATSDENIHIQVYLNGLLNVTEEKLKQDAAGVIQELQYEILKEELKNISTNYIFNLFYLFNDMLAALSTLETRIPSLDFQEYFVQSSAQSIQKKLVDNLGQYHEQINQHEEPASKYITNFVNIVADDTNMRHNIYEKINWSTLEYDNRQKMSQEFLSITKLANELYTLR